MNRRLVLLAGLGLLTGCATAPAVVMPSAATHPELEAVYSAIAGRDALTLQVASNGCTRKDDFAFYVDRKGLAPTVSFARKRLDQCRSFAMGKTELRFTWAELGLEPRATVFLLNPVTAWTGPGL
ncbi:MAG: hypothetical protein C0481_09320 [Phenylobacterium sp.]|uniref:hypothetical protein n=1 Tax=Phenylobacterium sp. TaxID=1871053 RepID=UPI0025ECFBA9|nr:hypothetical protein [Phenylobacterium sp.]MBA4012050.1 hypothetical protein [Phenylobacterium sp.]